MAQGRKSKNGFDGISKLVEKVFADGVSRGERRIIGQMSSEDMNYLRSQGVAVATGEIELEDRLMVGAKAQRHQRQGNALGLQEWKELPVNLSQSQTVLFDHKNKTLLYAFPGNWSQQ